MHGYVFSPSRSFDIRRWFWCEHGADIVWPVHFYQVSIDCTATTYHCAMKHANCMCNPMDTPEFDVHVYWMKSLQSPCNLILKVTHHNGMSTLYMSSIVTMMFWYEQGHKVFSCDAWLVLYFILSIWYPRLNAWNVCFVYKFTSFFKIVYFGLLDFIPLFDPLLSVYCGGSSLWLKVSMKKIMWKRNSEPLFRCYSISGRMWMNDIGCSNHFVAVVNLSSDLCHTAFWFVRIITNIGSATPMNISIGHFCLSERKTVKYQMSVAMSCDFDLCICCIFWNI